MQGYRAKWHAIELRRGSVEELFTRLPTFCHNLKWANPGTVTKTRTNDSQLIVGDLPRPDGEPDSPDPTGAENSP